MICSSWELHRLLIDQQSFPGESAVHKHFCNFAPVGRSVPARHFPMMHCHDALLKAGNAPCCPFKTPIGAFGFICEIKVV